MSCYFKLIGSWFCMVSQGKIFMVFGHCMLPFRTQINTFFSFLMLHSLRSQIQSVRSIGRDRSTYAAYVTYVAYIFDRICTFTLNVEKRRNKIWVTFVHFLRSDQTYVKKARHEDLFMSRHKQI